MIQVSTNLPIEGVELIKEFENCYLKAYPDPRTGGKPITIGWGTTVRWDGGEWELGDSISQCEADSIFRYQLTFSYLATLAKKIPYWTEMNVFQQGALLCFAYNMGKDFFGSDGFDTISRNLRQKNWSEVPDTLTMYYNPGSNVQNGLKRRRIAEGYLWSKSAN